MAHFLVLSVLPSAARLLEGLSNNLSAEIRAALLEGRFQTTVLETVDLPITSRQRVRWTSGSLEPMQHIRGDAHRFTLHRRRLG